MMFHPDKCKVMDICKKRKDRPKLTMEKFDSTDRHTLEYTEMERDLAIIISHSLNMGHKVMNAAAKANIVLSILRKTFKFWTPSTSRILFHTPTLGIRSIGMVALSQEGHPSTGTHQKEGKKTNHSIQES
jgi:hypothetical protein